MARQFVDKSLSCHHSRLFTLPYWGKAALRIEGRQVCVPSRPCLLITYAGFLLGHYSPLHVADENLPKVQVTMACAGE